MSDLFAQLRANPRLRLGLWVVAAILASYPVVWLHDYRQELTREYYSAVERLQRLQEIRTQQGWEAHAQAATALREGLENKLWRAQSKGLAQATLQAWLQERIKTLEVERARVDTEAVSDVVDMPGVWKVSAKCGGVFVPEKLEQLLKQVSEHPQWLSVEHLEIRHSFTSSFTLLVNAYFLAPAENHA